MPVPLNFSGISKKQSEANSQNPNRGGGRSKSIHYMGAYLHVEAGAAYFYPNGILFSKSEKQCSTGPFSSENPLTVNYWYFLTKHPSYGDVVLMFSGTNPEPPDLENYFSEDPKPLQDQTLIGYFTRQFNRDESGKEVKGKLGCRFMGKPWGDNLANFTFYSGVMKFWDSWDGETVLDTPGQVQRFLECMEVEDTTSAPRNLMCANLDTWGGESLEEKIAKRKAYLDKQNSKVEQKESKSFSASSTADDDIPF